MCSALRGWQHADSFCQRLELMIYSTQFLERLRRGGALRPTAPPPQPRERAAGAGEPLAGGLRSLNRGEQVRCACAPAAWPPTCTSLTASCARLPVTPGRGLVGEVVARRGVRTSPGKRVGVPCSGAAAALLLLRTWAGKPRESAQFTGCTLDGGYAEYAVADARYCLGLPERYTDEQAAPLLCAGLIGFRAYRAAGDAQRLGLYGFGAAAHLLAQIALAQNRRVFALTRPGDTAAQIFARELGAEWAGGSDERPPVELDAAIIFAPLGELVPAALAAIRRGGRVVCAGIHMSNIPAFPYDLLWGERSLCSVANLTRADGEEFMRLAGRVDLHPVVQTCPLESANDALGRLRRGDVTGALVLRPG
jgi:propanol-preferring alcohol dehydrogenase